jgi:hypothetical protein
VFACHISAVFWPNPADFQIHQIENWQSVRKKISAKISAGFSLISGRFPTEKNAQYFHRISLWSSYFKKCLFILYFIIFIDKID